MEKRENCPRCGDTRGRLYSKRVYGGWVRHCHNQNCYAKDSFLPDKSKPQEIIAKATQLLYKTEETQEHISTKPLTLPYDFTNTISKEGMIWLSKYEITQEEITEFNIGYSPRLNRLILPVYQDNKLIYWQGRNLGKVTKDNPKYLNIRNSGAKNVFFQRSIPNSNMCVIVEDILSAIKVGRVCNSLALLGSYFPKEIYQSIIPQYDKILIWLDADKYHTAFKAGQYISTFCNKAVKIIRTDKDPKEYTNAYIYDQCS